MKSENPGPESTELGSSQSGANRQTQGGKNSHAVAAGSQATANKNPLMAWIYLASAGMSMLGNSVAQIVWPWLILQRTGDPAAAGFVATVVAVPSLIFAFVGGHLIDSVGRKKMSIISDIISGLSVASVIVVDQIYGLNLWWFIALGIIGAIGDIPGMAARNALVADASHTSGVSIEKISGINQGIIGITFLIGPALAGLLMTALDIKLVLIITAACSLLAAGLTAMLRLSKSADTAEDGAVDPAHDFSGWRAWGSILSTAAIRMLAVVALISNLLVMPLLMVLLPAQFESMGKPLYLGLSMSAFAVGMIVGGGLVTVTGVAYRKLIWIITTLLYSAAFVGTAFLGTTWAVFAGMFAAGLGGGLFNPVQMLIVTEAVPDKLRGRAFSLFTAINLFAAPIGLSIATIILKFHSIYWLAIALAVVWMPCAAWAIIRGSQILPNYVPKAESEG